MISDPKLPDLPRRSSSRRAHTNEWLAADQREKARMVTPVAIIAVILAAGLWLMVGNITT